MPLGLPKNGHQALGRSRGGWGTKIHLSADALGNPLSFTLTGAEQADISQAPALLSTVDSPHTIIADKAYDADSLIAAIKDAGTEAVIPPCSNRIQPRAWDRHRYRARHLIENLFARLKQYRRLATRYEKLASQFAGFVTLASLCIWLK